MKEKDVRDKIGAVLTSTPSCSEQALTVMYAASFPSGVYAYAAPMPWTKIDSSDFVPYTPAKPTPERKVKSTKVDKCELDELILGVLALKGQTVEIFKLKALVCAIRERVERIL